MTFEKAHELTAMHPGLNSCYNRNSAEMVPGEVMRDHRQQAVNNLIREYELETQREIKPGTKFESAFKS